MPLAFSFYREKYLGLTLGLLLCNQAISQLQAMVATTLVAFFM
ncbi:hypothetical protein [Nitrosospira sp. Nsp13]|jgi:hypothetical protein|nr:hypothetical protein [Nitrosospira sp. Nsp13]